MIQFEEHIDFLLANLCRVHHKRVTQALEKIGLHKGQPPLLIFLRREDGKSHSQLAEEMDVTPATISNMIKRMERAGFVIRKRDTKDERVSRVYLTDAGRDVFSQAEEAMYRINEIVTTGFTQDEQEILRSYLKRIIENLGN